MVYPFSDLMGYLQSIVHDDSMEIVLMDNRDPLNALVAISQLHETEQAQLRAWFNSRPDSTLHRIELGSQSLVAKKIQLTGTGALSVVVLDSVDVALQPLSGFKQQLFLLSALFGAIALLVSYYAAFKFTSPLQKLVTVANRLEKGDFSTEVDIDQADEIGELAVAFSRMQAAILRRERQVDATLDELEHQAGHDALTGLANRITLAKELEKANQAVLDAGERYSLCIMDLDRFKIVNDTSGHGAGDALLIKIARLLRESVYPCDTVARLGGDEFAVIFRDCSESVAVRVCEKIRQQIEDLDFIWQGTKHKVGASIGVLSTNQYVEDISELMQRADAGCFVAKDAGRNTVYQITETQSVEEKRTELHWVQRLNNAVDNNELILYTQPLVPLQSLKDQDRVEVLVRLRNYDSGDMVPPGAFIPSAERYGLNTKVDRWVVSTLIKSATTYQMLFDDSRLYWVNLSGASFADGKFTDFLENSILESNLPEGSLNFEITETAVIKDLDAAAEAMSRLRDLGCQFALDDFGSGLTSFSFLKALPIDYLKIDGSFIANILDDPVDRIFVKSIIDIAHEMSMQTVAEHVESHAVFEELRAMGANYGQGYFFAKPTQFLPEHVKLASRSSG